ncbi:TIR domain-containing protein [Macellibacteroides fermentans]|uniref:TIR domain-containing protein n=1 Tax=Macellibacteroides fermentans TaxID=879969 RepID=UPI00406C51EA
MGRRVFFSFHYERDAWRAAQVRNSGVTKNDAGFIDSVDWEEVKRKGDRAVKEWIDGQLKGTSVTVILIGNQTADRKYVQYEIKKSVEKGNGFLGIRIHDLEDKDKKTDLTGKNPLTQFYYMKDNKKVILSDIYRTYSWKRDSGYKNFGKWIEEAASIAGK